MSPRAAWRLEPLGFGSVFDYVAGKSDWLAAGLPSEGSAPKPPRAGGPARRQVATCGPDDTVASASSRVASSEWTRCAVLNEAGVVMGLLDENALAGADDACADEVMRLGRGTVRANADLGDLLQRMRQRGAGSVLVTDPDGRLLGRWCATTLRRRHLDQEPHERAEGDVGGGAEVRPVPLPRFRGRPPLPNREGPCGCPRLSSPIWSGRLAAMFQTLSPFQGHWRRRLSRWEASCSSWRS